MKRLTDVETPAGTETAEKGASQTTIFFSEGQFGRMVEVTNSYDASKIHCQCRAEIGTLVDLASETNCITHRAAIRLK